jgi:hypothetical protein
MLLKSGFRPVSMVVGNCVYHVAHQTLGGWFKTAGQNVEMQLHPGALRRARARDGAAAVRGAVRRRVGRRRREISTGPTAWEPHVIEFFAVGTSVLPIQTIGAAADAAARHVGRLVTAQPSQRAFTSDLTIDELLLVEEVGFEPVELVLGTSYFHTGWGVGAGRRTWS